MFKNFLYQNRKFRLLQVVLIFFSVLLILIQFFSDRSLWLDEAALALNIIYKGPLELLDPLDFGQMAPPLFLLLLKSSHSILPDSTFGFRLFPLLFYLASLYYFIRLSQVLLQNQPIQLLLLAFFVFNQNLIYFSSETKQYMGDVLVVLVFLYHLTRKDLAESKRLLSLTLIGVVAIFFSNITPIIFISVSAYILYDSWKKPWSQKLRFISMIGLWGILSIFYYYHFIFQHPLEEYMKTYWVEKGGFPNIQSGLGSIWQFFRVKSNMLFVDFIGLSRFLKYPLIVLYLIGSYRLYQKNKRYLILIYVPLLVHFLFSTLHLYPFELRLVLYLYPLLLVGVGLGLEQLIIHDKYLQLFQKNIQYLILGFILVFLVKLYRNNFPFEISEVKKFRTEYFDPSGQEKLLIYGFARYPFRFYEEIDSDKLGENIQYLEDFTSLETYLHDISNKEKTFLLVFLDFESEEIEKFLALLDKNEIQLELTLQETGVIGFLFQNK